MTETLTITQMISEEKNIRQQIANLISTDFKLISHYQKNRPFCGARTASEQENVQKEKVQTLSDLLKRLSAIKKAHTKANRETIIAVPEEPNLLNFINGKEAGKEEITIAEAINRKNAYKRRQGRSNDMSSLTMEELAASLLNIYTKDFNSKERYDNAAKQEVQEQLNRRFPIDSKNSWSQEKYSATKKELEEETEVIRIDPYNLIENSAIQKFYEQVQRYILDIDTILSQANASTLVEFEY